jgi:hypothetical protein
MSHFAQINEENIVIQVLVGDNEAPDEGLSWFQENIGGRWVQTSFNAKFRKNFASVGYSYDEERDAFIAPQPFDSWVLNEETAAWEAPVPYPADGLNYYWNDASLSWVEKVIKDPNA